MNNINYQDNITGNSLLHDLLDEENDVKFDILFYFLNRGANVNLVDKNKNTPLHIAFIKYFKESSHFKKIQFEELILLILKKKADINLKNNFLKTPLQLATENGEINPKMIPLLVECKADPSTIDKKGRNFLHIISSNKYINFHNLNLLFESKFDPNLQENQSKRTPFHYIVENKFLNQEIFNLFIENDSSLLSVDFYKTSVLHLLAKNAKFNFLKYIENLQVEEDFFSTPNEMGKTLLHIYCSNEHLNKETARFLIEKKCDPNEIDDSGRVKKK